MSTHTQSSITKTSTTKTLPTSFLPHRTVHWTGPVGNSNYLDTMDEIRSLIDSDPMEYVNLVITSAGGPTGIAMSFYDSMRKIYKARLRTIGSGDVDSAGILLFLSGTERFITPNTTMLLHLAGRHFENNRRYTAFDLEAMAKEDRLKDFQYASVVSENSLGRLSTQKVLDMMSSNTILTGDEAVELGIAHRVL